MPSGIPRGYTLDRPFTLSCPECCGVTRRETRDGLVRYRCHIGHVLTAETMLHAQRAALEHHLGASLALLNEHAELCRLLIEAARDEGRDPAALETARDEVVERAETVRSLLEDRWTLPEAEPGT